MKNMILMALIFVASTVQAHAFRLPLQVSKDITRQILDSIGEASTLDNYSLTKLSISKDFAKIELEDGNGACVASAYDISYDNQGAPTVTEMIDAFVVCDETLE